MKSQSDSNAINTALNNIKERLLKERDTRRRYEIESANASANGYVRGVADTLAAVAAAAEAAEQQAQNAPRTNLDRIRAMSAEEMALWLSSRDRECGECLAADVCKDVHGIVCEDVFVMWLNSPAKEDGENA